MKSYRTNVAVLALSAAGLVGIVLHEGYSDKAYIPVPGDKVTLGFGSTQGVKLGDTTTPQKALERAQREISAQYEPALKACVKVPLSQAEYDVYVDLAYNIGTSAFCRSTLVKRLNAGDYKGACEAILQWKMYQGKDCSLPANKRLCGGLWTRRQVAYEKCSQASV